MDLNNIKRPNPQKSNQEIVKNLSKVADKPSSITVNITKDENDFLEFLKLKNKAQIVKIARAKNISLQDYLLKEEVITEENILHFRASKKNAIYKNIESAILNKLWQEKLLKEFNIELEDLQKLGIVFLSETNNGKVTITSEDGKKMEVEDKFIEIAFSSGSEETQKFLLPILTKLKEQGYKIQFVLAKIEHIEAVYLNYTSGKAGEIEDLILMLSESTTDEDDAISSPAVKVLNGIIKQGIELGASDIHIQKKGNDAIVRYRVDGRMIPFVEFDIKFLRRIAIRFMFLTGMKTDQWYVPQAGAINGYTVKSDSGEKITCDLRAATLPVGIDDDGNSILALNMRISKRAERVKNLHELGFTLEEQDQINEMLYGSSSGIILVVGPTGSGKSNTLYAMLQGMVERRPDKNILTVENPVEQYISGLLQVTTDDAKGLTFGEALKAFLRFDPDVILVGEIRDYETGETALHAAQSGHLTLATLHANSSLKAIERLSGMGIKEDLIQSTLRGVISQRLVPKLCPDCKVPVSKVKFQEKLNEIGYSKVKIKNEDTIFKKGNNPRCKTCGGQGYKGRMKIAEKLLMNERLGQMIKKGLKADEIQDIMNNLGKFIKENNSSITQIKEKFGLNLTKLVQDGLTPSEMAKKIGFYELFDESIILVKGGNVDFEDIQSYRFA